MIPIPYRVPITSSKSLPIPMAPFPREFPFPAHISTLSRNKAVVGIRLRLAPVLPVVGQFQQTPYSRRRAVMDHWTNACGHVPNHSEPGRQTYSGAFPTQLVVQLVVKCIRTLTRHIHKVKGRHRIYGHVFPAQTLSNERFIVFIVAYT